MTTYAILLPGVEDHRASASAEERARVYAEHGRFSETLGAPGHSSLEVRPCLTGEGA